MAKKTSEKRFEGTETEFIKLFRGLCNSRSSWQVWQDFISASAISLANVLDPDADRKEKREKEYSECIERLGGEEIPSQMFGSLVKIMDKNPYQDFLGRVFMELGLGSNWHGQFFTPFSISHMMAMVNIDPGYAKEEIEQKGWMAINDPSCGAGSTLIGAVTVFRQNNIDYQNHVMFVANDISRVAAQMCFIQLSLLGCAGYVVVTDTLANPVSGASLFPDEKEGQEFWYTPIWWGEVWTYRRMFKMFDMKINRASKSSGFKIAHTESCKKESVTEHDAEKPQLSAAEQKREHSETGEKSEQLSLFDFIE